MALPSTKQIQESSKPRPLPPPRPLTDTRPLGSIDSSDRVSRLRSENDESKRTIDRENTKIKNNNAVIAQQQKVAATQSTLDAQKRELSSLNDQRSNYLKPPADAKSSLPLTPEEEKQEAVNAQFVYRTMFVLTLVLAGVTAAAIFAAWHLIFA